MARKKKFKPEERDAIAGVLHAVALKGAQDDLENRIETMIDKVQFLVPHTRNQGLLYDKIDVPEDFKKQYREASKHIEEILWLIDHDYYKQHIGDYPPGLRAKLEKLKYMVTSDLPAGRGRKKSTPKRWLHELVQVLAQLFHEISQSKPTTRAKEAHDPGDEVEPPNLITPFEEFVHACTNPFGVKCTDHDIKQGHKLFLESVSK